MNWTEFQYYAIIFDGISLLVIFTFFIVKYIKLKRYADDNYSPTDSEHSVRSEERTCKVYYFWHFWPGDSQLLSRSSVDIVYNSVSNLVINIEEKGLCCQNDYKIEISPDLSIVEAYENLTCGYVTASLFVSCYIGIFIHFLPCFVWACDWSVNDNAGVRGGIWFGLWILLFILSFTPALRKKGVTIRNKINSVWLAYTVEEINDFIGKEGSIVVLPKEISELEA